MEISYYISLISARGMLLIILAIAWIMGILTDSVLQLPPQPCLLLSGLIFLFLIISWRKPSDRLLLLLLLCISLGAWRYSRELPQYDLQRELPQYDRPSVQRFIDPTSSLGIRGEVSDEPKLQTWTRLLIVSVNAVQKSASSPWENVDGKIEVLILFNGSSAEDPYGANYGDRVELHGKLQPPTPISPKNVTASMSFPRIHVSATGGNAIIATIYHLRLQLATQIEQALPQPEAALLIGIFLGLPTPALNLLALAFKATGTTHLLVASGSNVSIISGIFHRTTQYPLASLPKSGRNWIRTILLLQCIAFYTVLSGAGPATVRAGIMGGILVIAPALDKRYNVYTGLAVAAFLMSFIDPLLLWDISFLLSFVATLGIVLLPPYLQKLLRPITRFPAEVLIIEMIAVTLAAQIATLPILVAISNHISLSALPTNMLVAPLGGPLIILGMAIGVIGFVFHPLSLLCGWIAYPLLWYMKTVVNVCYALPYSYIPIDSFPISMACLYYTLLTLAVYILFYRYPPSPAKHHSPLRSRKRFYIGATVLTIVITSILVILPPSTTRNTISFFGTDVTKANEQNVSATTNADEQPIGEAIFVRTQDGKTLLIDGGNSIVSLSQLLDEQLPPWRRSLDMVILTSPQQDTITGLQDVITRYNVGSVFDAGMAHPTTNYARWKRIINERNLQYTPVMQGTTITLGTSTQIQVLWPQDRLHTGSTEIRDNGLILRLVMPGLRLLLLGSSIESNYALSGLLASVDGNMLKSDIAQILGNTNTPVPSVLTNVLQQAQPSQVVVTSPMQHKSRQSTNSTRSTLSSVLASIPQVWQTTESGTIELHSNSKGWAMSG